MGQKLLLFAAFIFMLLPGYPLVEDAAPVILQEDTRHFFQVELPANCNTATYAKPSSPGSPLGKEVFLGEDSPAFFVYGIYQQVWNQETEEYDPLSLDDGFAAESTFLFDNGMAGRRLDWQGGKTIFTYQAAGRHLILEIDYSRHLDWWENGGEEQTAATAKTICSPPPTSGYQTDLNGDGVEETCVKLSGDHLGIYKDGELAGLLSRQSAYPEVYYAIAEKEETGKLYIEQYEPSHAEPGHWIYHVYYYGWDGENLLLEGEYAFTTKNNGLDVYEHPGSDPAFKEMAAIHDFESSRPHASYYK